MSVVRDILDAMAEQGFKRILIVNGHGGNTPAQGLVGEWIADHPGVRIKFHNWWNAPKVWAQVQAIDPSLRTRRGWKIFRGRAWRRSSYPRSRSR